MELLDCLVKVGFTKHEAMLYEILCREGGLTGYEAAKLSGISRSNAYLALAGLVDKGGAFRIDGDPSRYSAIPAKELVFNLRKRQEEYYRFIEDNSPVHEDSKEPYYTITGSENIVNKMSHIISHAKERIYISTSPKELAGVRIELESACKRGLKVVVITSEGFVLNGATIYLNEKQPGQIRLIADTAHVLTGEIKHATDSTALYSRNSNLINLIKDSLKNEIELIHIRNGQM